MNKKVLIVDDEDDVLSVLEKRLSVFGFEVLKAKNGPDAINIARSAIPDLIILDVMMPGMEGGDVAAALKNTPITANIPVIFLTCLFTKNEESNLGHKLGHELFVAKPYNFDELLDLISQKIK